MANETEMVIGRYPASLLLDILSDGMDYAARGFWAQINHYKWYWWFICDEKGEPIYPTVPNPELTPDTVLLQMRDDEDGEAETEDREWSDITLAKLAEATDWAREHYSHLLSWSVHHGLIDDIDYDGIGADIIVQKVVLGEVIYG